jgi:Disulphide bond corrector protein DsbC
MKTKKHLLMKVFLCYLIFSSCSDKKPEANEKEKNPFGITSDTGTQILQPCHWSFTVEQSGNGEAILVSTAKLDSGWHLYSQHISDKGPQTEFVYDSLSTYKLLGDTEEGKPSKEYNPYLEMDVLYFEKEAVFKQKINVLSEIDFTITGNIDYMVCLTQCVNSDEEFSFKVKGNPEGK